MFSEFLASHGTSYQGAVFRIVETQEQAATLRLVDNLEEQGLLEELLDDAKPPYREGTERLDYLLKTPFRYPPLRYGSRFGDVTTASFFYASEALDTCLIEAAYYRFVFLEDMQEPFGEAIVSEHMVYSVRVLSQQCADLTRIDHPALIHRADYRFTQQLGKWLVDDRKCQMIRYRSARDVARAEYDGGINVAVADPNALSSSRPENQTHWFCEMSVDRVVFRERRRGQRAKHFPRVLFELGGALPQPAG